MEFWKAFYAADAHAASGRSIVERRNNDSVGLPLPPFLASSPSPKSDSNVQSSQPITGAVDPVDPRQFERDLRRCEIWRDKLLKNSPMVKFMIDNLERVRCPFRKELLQCVPCDAVRSGGFSPGMGVVLCQNRFTSRQHMEDTLTHELIHAYDFCTTKINFNNCEQHACTEIRAANLSGECKFTREVGRGYFALAKHHQVCVRRRAILSLKQNPSCAGPNVAEDAVRAVWNSCFRDTAPFDEIA